MGSFLSSEEPQPQRRNEYVVHSNPYMPRWEPDYYSDDEPTPTTSAIRRPVNDSGRYHYENYQYRTGEVYLEDLDEDLDDDLDEDVLDPEVKAIVDAMYGRTQFLQNKSSYQPPRNPSYTSLPKTIPLNRKADYKIVENNNDLKKRLFSTCGGIYGASLENPNTYTYINLDEDSDTYAFVSNKMKVHPGYLLIVKSIQKVENPYLRSMYNLKKNDLKTIYGNKLIERYLFHATQKKKVDSICKKNFDHRLCGSQRGTRYGHGISFSPKFFYASHFAGKGIDKVMFLCKVLYVDAHVGDENTIVPKEGYDTTKRDNKRVFVKYDDDVFYPEYKICFNLLTIKQYKKMVENLQ